MLDKYGKTKSGNQRYICKLCKKTRVENYTYQAYKSDMDKNIIEFTKEGLGIRSTARILKISTTTLLKRIVTIAKSVTHPIITKGKTYEVDEMCTYIGHKRNFIWLTMNSKEKLENILYHLMKKYEKMKTMLEKLILKI